MQTDTLPPGSAPRPALTLMEAAEASGKSRDTVKRRLLDGAFPGAFKDASGAWRVPVEELLAAGFKLHQPAPPDAPGEPQGPAPSPDAALTREVERLRAELSEARAVAAERERTIDLLAVALRALPAAPAAPARPLRAAPVSPPAPPQGPALPPPQASRTPEDRPPTTGEEGSVEVEPSRPRGSRWRRWLAGGE